MFSCFLIYCHIFLCILIYGAPIVLQLCQEECIILSCDILKFLIYLLSFILIHIYGGPILLQLCRQKCIDREGTAVGLRGVLATAVIETVDIYMVIILFSIDKKVVIILFCITNQKYVCLLYTSDAADE